MTALLFVVLLSALFISVPIGLALIFSVFIIIHVNGNMSFLTMVVPKMFTSVDNFSYLAVPCFLFAGNLMVKGGISKRLVAFMKLLLGRMPAAHANITVGTSAFFGAISGSNSATVAAVGGLMIPEMMKEGYPRDVSAAVAASAGTLGVVIPPSVPMVTYAVVVSCSVSTLFMAGFLPGLMLASVMMITNSYLCGRYESRRSTRVSLTELWAAFKDAFLALMMPFIILGGIYGGICTPTEAAAVACFYGLIVSVFVYREVTLKDVVPILISSSITASAILFVVGCSTPFQWLMTSTGMAQGLAAAVIETFTNKYVILLMFNFILLFLGCFLETAAIILLTVPVLYPIASAIGVDPIHLGLIVVVNTSIGMITPPMAFCLFVASGIAKTGIEKVSRKIWPYLIVEIVVLAAVTYVPDTVLVLPRLVLGYTG
jgi:C4-dicarboxylate transporter DctM subunit